MNKILPIILSGGSGKRLWPLSRKLLPKQFIPLLDKKTLFQATVERARRLANTQDPLVVCNEDHRFLVADQLRKTGQINQTIILEPVGKNTAPAIALAAFYTKNIGIEDPLLLVLPADHVITDINTLNQALETGTKLAMMGQLVTFGIVPKSAETGYGYIKHDGSNKVLQFVEKPNQENAQYYLDSGKYLWNSGIFLFKASSYISALSLHAKEVLIQCQKAMDQPAIDNDFVRVNEADFKDCPGISVDYAVMEKATNASVVSLDCEWSDVGAWSAVWEIGHKDSDGNVLRGDVLAYEAKDNLVYSDKRLVALLGIEDSVVIDTKDTTLVAHREHMQKVKEVVNKLETEERPEVVLHREVYRPWGSYDCIDKGERFQVKRIYVKPGAKLSLQKHHHRAEHWIVIKGIAEVRCGNEVSLLKENQSTFIPLGEIHQLANPGTTPLEIIEVQSGDYLGEDDIVRLEDIYGRKIKD